MKKPPKIIASKTLAQTRVFTIEQMQLQFANGNQVEYERIVSSSSGAVLIVPLLDDKTIVMSAMAAIRNPFFAIVLVFYTF